MKTKLHRKLLLTLVAFFTTGTISAQMVGDHAYMIGDYVILGISANGHEGAPCLDTVPCTAPPSGLLGMLANPAMDDWVTINGDFFSMGAPESGFGVQYTYLGDTYGKSNNAFTGLNEIDGEITEYYETTDSIIVTWVGQPVEDELELTIIYELKKDQHYYTTSMMLDNIGVETFTDVYYYRNLDPDNNQSSGAGFSTENTIISQSEMADDSVIVKASQDAFDSHVVFHAYGADWKGFYGGFSNRNASEMWNAEGPIIGTEGASITADVACGVAYKIETLPPGKAASDVFSFATAFKPDVVIEEEPNTSGLGENNIKFELYPNPSNGDLVNLNVSGFYNYAILDLKGSITLSGTGNELTQIDVNGIEKGIYFIQIQQDNHSVTEKLIIQ